MLKRLILILLIAAAAVTVGLLLGDYLYFNQRFPGNCYIENLPVSNLTVGEVIKMLKEADIDSICQKRIVLETSEEVYEYAPSEIGAYIKPAATAYKAFQKAYDNSYFRELAKRVIGSKRYRVLPLELGLDEDKARSIVSDIAANLDVPSREARCLFLDEGGYKITRERIGAAVETEETVRLLKRSFADGGRSCPLVVDMLIPRVLAKDLVKDPPTHFLASYKTHYGNHDSPNRIHNIKLIAAMLDNYIILSGETFSLTNVIGMTTKDKGFKEAFVIIKGELVPQYGGGACQIATTLYNVAMISGLEIVSRHNHAIYFYIYPLGRDAAIYSDTLDLKFKNNTPAPLMLKAEATRHYLRFVLYGTPTNRTVNISSPKVIYDKGVVLEGTPEASDFDKPFSTVIERTVSAEGHTLIYEKIRSYYKFAGETNNIKIVRPEPE